MGSGGVRDRGRAQQSSNSRVMTKSIHFVTVLVFDNLLKNAFVCLFVIPLLQKLPFIRWLLRHGRTPQNCLTSGGSHLP